MNIREWEEADGINPSMIGRTKHGIFALGREIGDAKWTMTFTTPCGEFDTIREAQEAAELMAAVVHAGMGVINESTRDPRRN